MTLQMMRQKGCHGLNLGASPVHLQRKVKITEGGGEMLTTLMKTGSGLLGAGLCKLQAALLGVQDMCLRQDDPSWTPPHAGLQATTPGYGKQPTCSVSPET